MKRSLFRLPSVSWRRRVLSVLIGTIGVLLVAEIVARGIEIAPRQLPSPSGMLCRPTTESEGLLYELVPSQTLHQLVPAWGNRPERKIHYTVNRQGFRGNPVPLARSIDEYRVVVVGDSFVFGFAVDDGEPFPALLEAGLQGQVGERRVRVVNLGVPGYEIQQLRIVLESKVAPLNPDLVLFNLYVNDPAPATTMGRGKIADDDPPPPVSERLWIERLGLRGRPRHGEEEITLQRSTVAWLQERSALFDRGAEMLFRRLSSRARIHGFQHRWREDGKGYQRVLEAIEHGQLLAREHGFAFHVSLFPFLSHLDENPLAEARDRLRAACVRRGIPFHDLHAALEGQEPVALWAYVTDHHPSPHCHALVAEALSRALAPTAMTDATGIRSESLGR